MSPIPSPISHGLANPSNPRSLESPYRPGKRCDAWVKRHETVPCAVVRIRAEGARGFNAFVLAADVAVPLAHAGNVGTRFDAAVRQQVPEVLRS